MRKAMICVSVLLALFQIWPMVFGHDGVGALAAATPARPMPAIVPVASAAKTTSIATRPGNNGNVLKSCQALYRETASVCSVTDPACGNRAIDKWDICDATGFWPE